MQLMIPRINKIFTIVLSIIIIFFCQPSAVMGDTTVSADKDTYNYGEMINVNFSNAPGIDGDWICIVPAGSPDTEAGDYKYMPKGMSQGSLTFDAPNPGKYEARAYYNYSRKGYVVTARYPFLVKSGPDDAGIMAQRMERERDPNKVIEANLPPGKGLVYIFREALFASYGFEVPVYADGKPLAVMLNSSYIPVIVPAGDINFSASKLKGDNLREDIESIRKCEITVTVKPGYVYYLRLRVIPFPLWGLFLDQVPHQEGANIIESYKLTLLKN